MPEIEDRIESFLNRNKGMLSEINHDIHDHPELGFAEKRAAARLTDALKAQGFSVQKGVAGMETAFTATKEGGAKGPHLAFLAEYDALPELGHACGHNLIATVALAAGTALAEALEDFKGRISVMGTPAEEVLIDSGKIKMLEQGVFDDVDVALMAHPAHHTWLGDPFLAANKVLFSFKGRPAHAAGAPFQGINAFDAVQLTFTGMSFQRQQLRQDARVHWGDINVPAAMNVIPDFASATIGVRATDNEYTEELTQKAINCIKGAALMTGCEAAYEIIHGYQAIKVNPALDKMLAEYLTQSGIQAEEPFPYGRPGSTDLGNVSQKVPASHPLFKIADAAPHTAEFCTAAGTGEAFETALKVAKALALTGARCMLEPETLARVKESFQD